MSDERAPSAVPADASGPASPDVGGAAISASEAQATGPAASPAPRNNPRFPVGVDYHPIDAERASAVEWYDADTAADVAAISRTHLSLVRLFVSWPALEPQVGQYDHDAEDRLADLLEAVRARQMKAIVCFFADDRLAEMNDVPWGRKRDLRTDDYLLQREIALVQRIVNRFRTESAVWAWELGNEAFFAGFTREEDLEAWAQAMREAVREVDTARAIVFGAGIETLVRECGVDARGVRDGFEYGVSRVTAPYRAYAAEGPLTYGPATYLDSFVLRAGGTAIPTIADGIGVHALDVSVAEEAAYTRVALYSALMNGAAGAVLRRWRDVETERREPYFRDPYEVLVGLNDTAGQPKPVRTEAARFARTVAHFDLRRYERVPERAAVLVPAERYEPLPSLAGLYDPRSCLQAYIAAKEAHLPVDLVREGEDLDGLMTVIVPSAGTLLAATWSALAAFVRSGGSLVLSYGGGDADPAVRELFGVEFLGDQGVRRTLACRVAQPGLVGDLAAFDAQLDLPHYAALGSSGATVVATDATGSPLLTVHQYGQGRTVFLAAPLERAIAQSDPWAAPDAVRHMLRTIYGAIASAAGAGPVIDCDQPQVEVAVWNGETADVVMALSHVAEDLTATLTADRVVASVTDITGGAVVEVGAKAFGVPLGPNGAAALRIVYR